MKNTSPLDLFPDHIENFWDYERNTSLPSEITIGQRGEVFFVCKNGHSFYSRPLRMAKVKVENFCSQCKSVAFLKPEFIPYFDSSKNAKTIHETPANGGRGIWLICPQNHSFVAKGYTTLESALKQCLLCKKSELSYSARHPDRAKMWDIDRNKIQIENLKVSDGTKRYFICNNEHKFARNPWAKVKGEFCTICSSKSLTDAYPYLVKNYWDESRNKENPSKLPFKSNGKFFFKCPKGHEFERHLLSLKRQQKEFCPECRLKEYSFEKVYPIASAMWSEKNTLKPDEITPGVAGEFWFICSKGHEYLSSLRAMKQQMCRVCSSQESEIEREIRIFLFDEGFGNNVTNTRKIIPPYEVDIYWKKLGKALEVNGDFFHSNSMVTAKTKFVTAKSYHEEKVRLAKLAGVELSFIWGHDWTSHQEEIKRALLTWLKEGKQELLLRKTESILDVPCKLCYKNK